MIRDARPDDAAVLAGIYNHYIEYTPATFEEQILGPDEFLLRMTAVESQGLPWLVAESGGEVLGYAYAGRWRERSAYRYSVESTVYLAPDRTGDGWGARLYRELFQRLEQLGLHAVIGGITLPNAASVALHEKMGMVKVAHFPQVGFKRGQWLDVGYWQLCFGTATPLEPARSGPASRRSGEPATR